VKVIIYTGENGRCMIYGDLDSEKLPMPGESVLIRNARMILKVISVGNLGIAGVGPKPGSDTRITCTVPQTTCTVKQAAECTPDAASAIEAWPCWM
jgi:hypothetical protein